MGTVSFGAALRRDRWWDLPRYQIRVAFMLNLCYMMSDLFLSSLLWFPVVLHLWLREICLEVSLFGWSSNWPVLSGDLNSLIGIYMPCSQYKHSWEYAVLALWKASGLSPRLKVWYPTFPLMKVILSWSSLWASLLFDQLIWSVRKDAFGMTVDDGDSSMWNERTPICRLETA